MEGFLSNEPRVPNFSCYPDIYSNASIYRTFSPHLIGRYFSDCNTIDNINRIRQSELDIEKYCVTKSGYFRLTATVALGMGITDGKILLCDIFLKESKYKKISTI